MGEFCSIRAFNLKLSHELIKVDLMFLGFLGFSHGVWLRLAKDDVSEHFVDSIFEGQL